jgi:hypothetical protein
MWRRLLSPPQLLRPPPSQSRPVQSLSTFSATCPDLIHRLLLRLLFAVLCVFLLARPAYADEAAARQYFRQGVDLYDKKKYAEALEAFRSAYREKPSAGIKQNIALCLKAQGKSVEAATAFDEALEEGQGQLKPETKNAMERELAELSKSIATITFKVVDEEGKPVDNVILTVMPGDPSGENQKRQLPPGAHRRPVRVEQGLWVFTASAPNHAPAPEKRLALVAGSPVDATFVLVGQTGSQGTLNVRASLVEASIRVDGVELGKGIWSGKVPAGNHKLEVSAPGYRTATIDVAVTANAVVEQPVQMLKIGEAPPAYDSPDRKPPKVKRAYVVPMAAFDLVAYRFSGVLDAPGENTRKGLLEISVGARAGYYVVRMLALELLVQAGLGQAKYKLRDGDTLDSEVNVGHWQAMPMVRFASPGKLRFTAGTGFGLHGISIDAKVNETQGSVTKKEERKGSGVAASWLLDMGLQVEAGPVFAEAALFVDVHGIGTVKDTAEDRRMLQSSPGFRGGLRLGLGIPF